MKSCLLHQQFLIFRIIFYSSWYIPNFPKAISEMVRVTQARGKIVFDVMNIHNEKINRIYRLHIFENKNPVGVIYKFFKNVIKFILGRGTPDWSILVSQTPSDAIAVFGYLSELEVTKVELHAWSENRLIKLGSNAESLHQFSRLIFSVVK